MKKIINDILKLFLGLIALYFLNLTLPNKYVIEQSQWLTITSFLFTLNLVVIFIIYLLKKFNSDKEGFAYMGLLLIKLFLSIVFLWPTLRIKLPETKIYVLHFITLFLVFLFVQVKIILQIISQKNTALTLEKHDKNQH
jgi:hypothetical protein